MRRCSFVCVFVCMFIEPQTELCYPRERHSCKYWCIFNVHVSADHHLEMLSSLFVRVFFFFFFLSQTCPFSFLLQLCFFRVSVLLSASLMCNFSPGVSVRLSGWLSLRMSTYCGVHSFSGGRVVGLLSHAKRKKKYYTYTCCIYVPANSVGDTYTHTLVFCTVQQTARTVRVSGGRQRCDVPKRT